jgi:hypothetical protein
MLGCVEKCPAGAIFDMNNNLCIACKDTNQFKLDNICIDSCPQFYSTNFQTFECYPCTDNCL